MSDDDIEDTLLQIERSRPNAAYIDDLTLDSLLYNVRSPADLARVIGDAPGATDVLQRVDTFLRFGDQVVDCADDELAEFARQLVQGVAAIGPRRSLRPSEHESAPPSRAQELVNHVAAMPIDITTRAPSDHAVLINGFASEIGDAEFETALPLSPRAELNDRQLDQFAGLASWWTRAERLTSPTRIEYMSEICEAVTFPDYFVGGYLYQLPQPDRFDHTPCYRIWEAGATTWLHADRVEVRRSGAQRWNFSNYR